MSASPVQAIMNKSPIRVGHSAVDGPLVEHQCAAQIAVDRRGFAIEVELTGDSADRDDLRTLMPIIDTPASLAVRERWQRRCLLPGGSTTVAYPTLRTYVSKRRSTAPSATIGAL
jgi:hypothetical protein